MGAELTSNPTVRKLSFTGSTEVGKLLMSQCAATVKKVSLELGGNAPFIVFDDADLDAAVVGAMASKYRNAGQTCVCANRILVQDGIHDAFAAKMAEAVDAIEVGNGLEDGIHQGPLIDMRAVEKVEQHIADATSKGAKLAAGGERHPLGGSFFQPTLLTGVTTAMVVAREETFGPVAPLFRFSTEDEAIHMANDTEFGLAAYFYSRDIGPHLAGVGGARIRNRRRQRGDHLERGGAVRRREGVGNRPRGVEVRHGRLPGDQVPLHGRYRRLATICAVAAAIR